MKCKCCKEEIADGATVCKHCGTHQGRVLRSLSQWSNAGIVISVILLLLSILQFRAARVEKSKASDALTIAQRAERLSKEAQGRIATYEDLTRQLRDELARTKELTELSHLTLRAESGDREALLALKTMCGDGDWKITTIAEKNLNRVWSRFKGMEISDPQASQWVGNSMILQKHDAVERHLDDERYYARAGAVDMVRFLRLNKLIPKVIEIGLTDPDLHVVQVACNTLNELLVDTDAKWQFEEKGRSASSPLGVYDFVIVGDRTKKELMAIWEARKEKLLAMKPKYWKAGEGSWVHLIDPEQPVKKSEHEMSPAVRSHLASIKKQPEFWDMVNAARSDDRHAFDQLRAWAQDSANPNHGQAYSAWHQIFQTALRSAMWGHGPFPWVEGVDPMKFSIKELSQMADHSPSFHKSMFVEYIWNRKDFSRFDRMQYLINVLENSDSLQAVLYARKLFSDETGVPHGTENFVQPALDWWERNKDKLTERDAQSENGHVRK